MADIEADGVVVSLDGGETYRFHDGSGSFTIADLAESPTPYIARAAGPAFEGSTLAALKAPARVSDPVLSGSAVLGGTVTRQSPGVVTSNPPPEMGPPLWAMRADSNAAAQIIQGASGETLFVDDAVFDVGHQIRTGTRFFNSQGEITLWSNWVEVTQIPTLQAAITPDPLVAGQPASVTFNTAIDGPPTIAQGQTAITATRVGQMNEWTFTPVAAGALIIAATADGYASSPWTFEVSPALPDLIVTPSSIFAIANVDAGSEPETLALSSPTAPSEMMGEWEIDFAPLVFGPVLLRDPYITGTPAVGETMTLHLPPPLSLVAGPEPIFDWSWPDGSKGKTYVNRAEDAGVPYDVDVTLTDGN
ncbi:hypothetical protein, partial [Paracoccus sp. 22332]|uniref:hypothetical protein n=1 Tax=Paracoccus sp. 22332 TaxID=3453913 RepID=UPI003F854010